MRQKYSKNVQKLIQKIRYQCKLLDVDFSLSKSFSVYTKEGDSCFGFFTAPNGIRKGVLRVGTGGKPLEEWVLTLAHEYAHMLQWFNNDMTFTNYEYDEFYYYELEIKTEKQAMKILKESGIPITSSLKNRSQKYIKRIREDHKNIVKMRKIQ